MTFFGKRAKALRVDVLEEGGKYKEWLAAVTTISTATDGRQPKTPVEHTTTPYLQGGPISKYPTTPSHQRASIAQSHRRCTYKAHRETTADRWKTLLLRSFHNIQKKAQSSSRTR